MFRLNTSAYVSTGKASGDGLHRPVRRARAARGTSLVEYAFVLIIFFSIIFGISGFGHALFAYHFVNEAAKEATRYASVRGSTCSSDGSCSSSNSASGTAGPASTSDVRTYVTSLAPQSIDTSKINVNVCGVSDSTICSASPTICTSAVDGVGPLSKGAPGCTVQVQVNYAYQFIFPLLPTSTGTTAPCTNAGFCLSSESDMVIVH